MSFALSHPALTTIPKDLTSDFVYMPYDEDWNPKKPIFLLLIGVSASGKTTFASNFSERGWFVSNRDTIRKTLFNLVDHQSLEAYWTNSHLQANELLVTTHQDTEVKEAVDNNQCIVIDDTNLYFERIEHFMHIIKSDALFCYKLFDIHNDQEAEAHRVNQGLSQLKIRKQDCNYKVLSKLLNKMNRLNNP